MLWHSVLVTWTSFALDEMCVYHTTVTDVYPESLSLCRIYRALVLLRVIFHSSCQCLVRNLGWSAPGTPLATGTGPVIQQRLLIPGQTQGRTLDETWWASYEKQHSFCLWGQCCSRRKAGSNYHSQGSQSRMVVTQRGQNSLGRQDEMETQPPC